MHDEITGVVLAGGQGRRMGGKDKGLLDFSGQTLIEHVLQVLSPQVNGFIINANRNQQRYATYGQVISDSISDFAGPLAGMLAAMEYVDTRYILSVPCDSPFLPEDLVERMWNELNKHHASIAVAHDGNRLQPVFAMIDTQLQDSLRNYLLSGERKIDLWFKQQNMITVDFSDSPDTFININRPEELNAEAHRHQELRP
ncbi:MAG: molybdenum cofactor guanylyltransferase [Gammaproteobacteria bacterium]|nr:molybdenum cofactor guanylyltransferase [Gammaproteobacteria bacterium]